MTYRIATANPFDAAAVARVAYLHAETLPGIIFPSSGMGYWWEVWHRDQSVAFAILCGSDRYPESGYFARVGVTPHHRGHSLQYRLMGVAEKKARQLGWTALYSDTRNRPYSAANFERRGWTQFTPEKPWDKPGAIYWMKEL